MSIPALSKTLSRALLITGALAALVALPGQALAAGDHGHGHGHGNVEAGGHGDAHGGHGDAHGGHHVNHLDNWFSLSFGPDKEHKNGPMAFMILNFAILIWLMVKFARKPFTAYLENRSLTVGKDLKEAAELNKQARDKLSQIDAKLKAMDQEIKEIKDAVAKDAEMEKDRIIKDAEAEAARIVEQADKTLDNELRRAKKTLEAEAVNAAMAAAEKMIKQKLNATDHKRLNDEYFAQIGASGGTN